MVKKISKTKEEQFLRETEEALKAPKKDHKIRISTMLDGDVLEALKIEAEKEGMKYQTFLNHFLRKAFIDRELSMNAISKDAITEALLDVLQTPSKDVLKSINKIVEANVYTYVKSNDVAKKSS